MTSKGIQFLQRLLTLYDTLTLDEAFKRALEILAQAVPCDLLDWYDMASLRRACCRFKCARERASAKRPRLTPGQRRRCFLDDIRVARRLSDCISPDKDKQHPLYELLSGKPLTRYGLIIRLEIPSMGSIAVSMKREKRDFSDGDIAAAEAVARLLARQLADISGTQEGGKELSPEKYAEKIADALDLSLREAEIAYWVFMGKRNKEIAQILGISPHTVRTHVQNIFHKQMVSSRFDLAHAVLRTLSDVPRYAGAPKTDAPPRRADNKKALPRGKGSRR